MTHMKKNGLRNVTSTSGNTYMRIHKVNSSNFEIYLQMVFAPLLCNSSVLYERKGYQL